MFALCCSNTIGSAIFKAVHEVKVQRSIHTIGDTASITVPLSARLKSKGVISNINVSNQFKRGDKVVINLGYNGVNKERFRGFVRSLNLKRPLEVTCDDYVFPLRTVNIKQSWKEVTLKTLLNYLAGQGGFTLMNGVPDITLEKVVITNQTVLWVLQEIKDKYGLCMFFTPENKLYCGMLYGYTGKTVKLDLDKYVIDPSDLKWVEADDIKLKVKAISFEKSGKRIEAAIGDDNGEIRTLHFYDVKDKAHLEKLAQAEIGKYKYTGYRGKIKLFLEPIIKPGDIVEINDPTFPERSGRYYVEAVETTFGDGGGRQIIEIGVKL